MPTIPLNPSLLTAQASPANFVPGDTGGVQLVEANLARRTAAIGVAQQALGVAGQIVETHNQQEAGKERAADIAAFEAEYKRAQAEAEAEIDRLSTTDATGAMRGDLQQDIQRIQLRAKDRVDKWLVGNTGGVPNMRHKDVAEEIANRRMVWDADSEVRAAATISARHQDATAKRFNLAESQIIADPTVDAEKQLERLAAERIAAGDEPGLVAARTEAGKVQLQRNRFANVYNSLANDGRAGLPMFDAVADDLEADLESPEGPFSALSQEERGRLRNKTRAMRTQVAAGRKTEVEVQREMREVELGKRFADGSLMLEDAYEIAGEDAELGEKWAGLVDQRNKHIVKGPQEKLDENAAARAFLNVDRAVRSVVEGTAGNGMDRDVAARMVETARQSGALTNAEAKGYMDRLFPDPRAEQNEAQGMRDTAVSQLFNRLEALVSSGDDNLELFAATEVVPEEVAAGLQPGDKPFKGWFGRTPDATKLTKADIAAMQYEVTNFLATNPNASSVDIEKAVNNALFPKETAIVQMRIQQRIAATLRGGRK